MAQGSGDKGLITLTGLWVQKSRDGRTYMAGRLGVGGKLMIFRNGKKSKKTDPDYYAVVGEWVQSDREQSDRQQGRDDEPIPF